MTAHVLTSELGNIIQESKKKNTELRNAAEKSLQDLRVLPTTSEAQIAADLRRRPHFITPLLLACKSGNSKLALPAVTCIQRLVVTGGLPSDRLGDVLVSFQECCKIGLDVQLRVLQSLPQLLQNYSDALQGELQSSLLQVCITLQQSKTAAVSGTASAILQQIVSLLYEKVESEDEREATPEVSVQLELDGQSVTVAPAAHDAYRVFEDLCLLTEGQKSQFIPNGTLSTPFGLELLEAVLTNHGELFHSHDELAYLLRRELMPLITRLFSERLSFSITVRTIRILCILLREHLRAVGDDCEVILSLLNHSLDMDSSVAWRRALCMETYRVLYSTPNLGIELYSRYDQNSEKKNIIQESLGTFVRLAAEKPALIGLGQQSSYPLGVNAAKAASNQEQALLETGGVAGIISGELGVAEVNAPGISTQWSAMRTPCLDQMDKAEPSPIPDTYAYSLVLVCLNALSDNLAKVILPLSMQNQSKPDPRRERSASSPISPTEEVSEELANGGIPLLDRSNSPPAAARRRLRAVPGNPLLLTDHPLLPAVQTIGHLIDACWPAILASSSTFLYAALDAEYYRALIRSFQRFTQISGLLRLQTPRDAFLTTLAKAAVPPNAIKTDIGSGSNPSGGARRTASGAFASVETFLSSPVLESPTTSRRPSLDIAGPSLSQRNLMCLRALINLAIALGAILDHSWQIILENLQKADSILAQSSTIASAREYRAGSLSGERSADGTHSQGSISSEIAAVEGAINRLFQSTTDYPNEAFMSILGALCDLITKSQVSGQVSEQAPASSHQRNPSIVGLPHSAIVAQPRNAQFAIAKIGEIARINISRLASASNDSGWTLLTEKLLGISTSSKFDNTARLMAADVLGNLAVGITVTTMSESLELREAVQKKALMCLADQIRHMYTELEVEEDKASTTDLDVHRSSLEALRTILEQCGENLIAGWKVIFNIIQSAFSTTQETSTTADNIASEEDLLDHTSVQPVSTRIARSAFSCVQLICSDFLGSLKKTRIIILINILSRFCSQEADLNTSLTTLTLFGELSDFLQRGSTEGDIQFEQYDGSIPDADLVTAAEAGSLTAVWLLLQTRLASVTADRRADVRNGAIHTIYRILDNNCERLSGSVWEICIRAVVFHIAKVNINAFQQLALVDQHPTTTEEQEKSLIVTANYSLGGIANIFSTHLNEIVKVSTFEDILETLLEHCASYMDLGLFKLTTYVFNTLSQILASAGDAASTNLPLSAVDKTWILWRTNVPSAPSSTTLDDTNNEEALTAYIVTFKHLYILLKPRITTQQILEVTHNLQRCVTNSGTSSYVSDIDTLTSLQSQILECLESLRTDLPNTPTHVAQCLSKFITLPYARTTEHARRSSTFIAFAKQSVILLQKVLNKHLSDTDIYTSGAVARSLAALGRAIALKYKWQKQGKAPSMWRIATLSMVPVLQHVLSSAHELNINNEVMAHIWTEIVAIIASIAAADRSSLPSNDVLLKDEEYDLEVLGQLRSMLMKHDTDTPGIWIGDDSVPDAARRAYAADLCRISIMHDGDTIPDSDPLQHVYEVRDGRIYDPSFTPRLRMCYSCIDELFVLTSTQATGRDNEALAKATFPYLILRCSLPLRRYIADQPLRGSMPTPMSQRLELLHILKKCKELRCSVSIDSKTAAEMSHNGKSEHWSVPVLNKERRHIEWLLPLVSPASRLARKDREIADALQGVIDVAFTD